MTKMVTSLNRLRFGQAFLQYKICDPRHWLFQAQPGGLSISWSAENATDTEAEDFDYVDRLVSALDAAQLEEPCM